MITARKGFRLEKNWIYIFCPAASDQFQKKRRKCSRRACFKTLKTQLFYVFILQRTVTKWTKISYVISHVQLTNSMWIIKVLKTDSFVLFLLFCSLRVVVEDKESSGGAFSMKVSPTATIERLQQEVGCREIPVFSQWIPLTLSCNINSPLYVSYKQIHTVMDEDQFIVPSLVIMRSLLRVLYKLMKI